MAGTPSVYVGRDRVLTMTPWGVKLITSASDLSITPDLVLTGEYDPSFLRFLERVIRPGDAVADVGANIGLFALRMAWLTGPGGAVHAFEPNPVVRALLADNVAMNYATWVQVSAAAVASTAGRRTLHVTTRFQGNSSLLAKDDRYRRDFRVDDYDEVEVDAAPLDDLVHRDRHLRLVKIDVEGAEAEVLDGMAGLVDRGHVSLIDVEINATGEVAGRLIDRLRRFVAGGARLWEVAPDGAPAPITVDEVIGRGPMPHLIVDLDGTLA